MAKLIPTKANSVYCVNGREILLANADQETLQKIQKIAPNLVREDKKEKDAPATT